jgi:hypothetical protein
MQGAVSAKLRLPTPFDINKVTQTHRCNEQTSANLRPEATRES